MYTQRTASALLEALEQGANQFSSRLTLAPLGRTFGVGNRVLPTSLKKSNNQLVLEMEVPGLTKDNITIELLEGVLTVKATTPVADASGEEGGEQELPAFIFNERAIGPIRERKFYLAKDLGTPKAEVKDGLLTLTFEIKEPQSQTIEVQ